MAKPLESLHLTSPNTRSSELKGKDDTCAKILVEAQRLVRIAEFSFQLNQLVLRACEILDDIDEILFTLHPVRNSADFAKVAALHRDLERIQEALRHPVRTHTRATAPGRAKPR